jgi:hypothetical protein
MQSDPFNLDRLQDIVTPEPVSWWPPAGFWWLVFAMIVVWGIYYVVLAVHRWIQNAYRRQALHELHEIEQQSSAHGQDGAILVRLSSLLKRVALVSFPRQEVASLSGEDWLTFLSQSCDQVDFLHGPSRKLGSASFDAGTTLGSEADWQEVISASRTWIGDHQAERIG